MSVHLAKKILAFFILVICVGCANLPQPQQNLVLCDQQQCQPMNASQSNALFTKLHSLFQINNGRASICTADAKSHACQKPRVCHFVLGGILPGNGCADQLNFSKIQVISTHQLAMQADMPLKFIGTPVICKSAEALFTLNTKQQLSLTLSPHFCSWMVMGAMTAQLDFQIDWINFDTNQLGGYWSHTVKGTGNGRGSGYMILQLSN